MISIKKLFLLSLVVGVSLTTFQPVMAAGTDVTLATDTSVYLSDLDKTVTIVAGSTLTSYTVNTGSIVISVEAGSSVILRSTDFLGFSINGAILSTCKTSYSEITLESPQAKTFTVTLSSSNSCSGSGSGGGSSSGGGGGGGGVSASYTSFAIAGGAQVVSTPEVTLNIAANSATLMMISNYFDFRDGSWEPFANTKTWKLTDGDGLKTVYLKFRTASGVVSTTLSDNITLSSGGAQLPAQVTQTTTGGLTMPSSQVTVPVQSQSPVATSYPRKLQVGSKGDDVTALQHFLESKNLLVMPKGIAYGTFGAATRKALAAYQKSVKLPATGILDSATIAKITGTQATQVVKGVTSYSLQLGSTGTDVVTLQNTLIAKGFLVMPKGIAKGLFGAVTEQAVKAFQKSVNLPETGIVDVQTSNQLNS